MPSIHFVRWMDNLKDTNHELYWFDILNRGTIETDVHLNQIVSWRKRKIKLINGEYFLSKNMPLFYNTIEAFLHTTIKEKMDDILHEIQPDFVHSFQMQSCCYPILDSLNKFKNIKWIYSCWGSDLFYYQNVSNHKNKIKKVLSRVNVLQTDCLRDFEIAKDLGFNGNFYGVIPGGTGFKLENIEKLKMLFEDRKIILVKGYQHRFGRAINCLKALQEIPELLVNYEVVVFGAHANVIQYVKENNLPFTIYDRHALSHEDLLKIMGKSILYIGNSISDGMPNTLLEAIVMETFPIQSNPGNVTAEIIEDGKNGLLIENPNDITEIKNKIEFALQNLPILKNAMILNKSIAEEKLDFDKNKQKVVHLYSQLENN